MAVSDWLSVLLSGASTSMTANANRKEGEYEAEALRTNALYAKAQSEDAISRGESDSMKAAVKARMMVGSQRAAMAAQGIDISSGSALDVQVDTARLSELDVMTIRNNASREAWGYQVQSTDYLNRAGLASRAGRNKSRTTLITGGLQTLRLIPK